MNQPGMGHQPDPGAVSTPDELTDYLRQLRRWAGQPSLRRLRQLGGTHRSTNGGDAVDALPESTTSYVLRGARPAGAQFVRSFVAACLRARRCGPDAIAAQVERWHQAWLTAAGHTAPGPTGPAPPAQVSPAYPVPRQLPRGLADFTGRVTELQALDRLPGGTGAPAPVAVAAITGAAGIGKTALAVQAAHRMADRYPDGQLFLDLHGFTAVRAPVEPEDALDRLLGALGVPGERIPAGRQDRAALWRSVLAGRRILILLDNAAAEDQVAPLLPGAPGCLVLVTSRRRLTGLEPTLLVSLDVLPAADAVALFTDAAGLPGPVTEDAELVAEVVEQCGRLPLALRIAAARLRSHPTWRLAELVHRLRDRDRRLTELADEGGQRSVATALAVTYQQLSADERRLYHRLGLHPGPDIDRNAAAALLDADPRRTERLLDQLREVHLLQEPASGRYTLHDLVRTHAATPGPGRARAWYAQRRAAVHRLLDYYAHTSSAAMDVAYPYERGRRPTTPPAGTPAPDLPDPATATRWLDTELPNLLATARHAARAGRAEHTWHLAATLHRHLLSRGRHHDAERLHQQALSAAGTHRHRTGELRALTALSGIHTVRGRYPQARECLRRGWELARATADRQGELDVLLGFGKVDRIQGWYAAAADRLGSALAIARDTGDRYGELHALCGLGETDLIQSRYQPATDNLEAALAIARDTGNPTGELAALLVLAEAHRLQGRLAPALDTYQQAWTIARAAASRYGELSALRGLGHVYRMQEQFEPARTSLEAALEIARATGARHGELGTLLALGHVHRMQGRYAQAAGCYRQVLTTAQDIDDRNWQFEGAHGLGRLHHLSGDQDLAVTYHRQALQLATTLEQPADQARAHDGLGHAHRALRQHPQARRHWQHALRILAELGTDHTEDEEASAPAIRTHLAGLEPCEPGH